MDSREFQELVAFIRKSLTYSAIGLSTKELQALSQRLDSDAFKAASAVDEFFCIKRKEMER